MSGSGKGLSSKGESGNIFDPNLKKLAEKLETVNDDEDSSKDLLENIRVQLKNFMVQSFIGKSYNLFMMVLSILSSFEYIFQTYLNLSRPSDLYLFDYMKASELFVACLFAFDWLLSFFIADHKLIFLQSFYSMVDLMTVIPIFTTYNQHCLYYSMNEYTYTFNQLVFYVLCGLNTTRILRALRVHRVLEYIEDEVQKCLAHMTTNIVVMILFSKRLFFSVLISFLIFFYFVFQIPR
jgi:hypothetical protein